LAVPEESKRQGKESLSQEIMAENILNLDREM
jgi:hypothetical protein